ncbi:MAG: hypothetical protein M5U28_22275 [Sandaracinaceae bacterium]|nr:hypothetical protein [Sandaracinaceae bacterium]
MLDVASLSRPALAPDGTLALLAQYDSGIVVWRLRDGEVADTHYTWRSADGLMDPVAAASGAVLAGLQGGVLLALEDDGDVVRVEIGSDETPHEIAVSHDGVRIAVLCNSGRIFSARMPLTPGGLTRHALLGTRRMRTVSFDHAGRIVAGGDAAQVQRETENGGWEPLPLPVQGTVTAVGWDRTGALLASDETGNIMRHARARWSRIGGVHQPALAVQDTPHHGIVAVRGDGRIYAQADRDFAELAGFDEQREARYGGAPRPGRQHPPLQPLRAAGCTPRASAGRAATSSCRPSRARGAGSSPTPTASSRRARRACCSRAAIGSRAQAPRGSCRSTR